MDDLKKYIDYEYDGGVDAFLAVYPAATDLDVRKAYLDSQRDQRFTLMMRRWAQGQTANGDSPVFLYFFSREPRNAQRAYFRAYHAAEIAYVFDNLAGIAARTQIEPADEALADAMSAYWVNFAKTGNPNGEGLAEWQPYSIEDAPYLEFGDAVAAGNHLLKPQLDYTEQSLKSLQEIEAQ
jgi:para-nitrobenzyl esterase